MLHLYLVSKEVNYLIYKKYVKMISSEFPSFAKEETSNEDEDLMVFTKGEDVIQVYDDYFGDSVVVQSTFEIPFLNEYKTTDKKYAI